MSKHIQTLVITKPGQSAVKLLKPFNELRTVPEYEKVCDCVGRLAHTEAVKKAEEKLGTFDSLREAYLGKLPQEAPSWIEYMTPFFKAIHKNLQSNPEKGKADLNCHECKGTGKYRTTANPQSKWSSYLLGGVFSNKIRLKKGRVKENLATTQVENDYDRPRVSKWVNSAILKDIDFSTMEKEENRKHRREWVQFQRLSNVDRELSLELPANISKEEFFKRKTTFIPDAILEPDGTWHEFGEEAWWPSEQPQKTFKEWTKEVKGILAKTDPLSVLSIYDLTL